MGSDAKSVHAAVASLIRDEGVSALGNVASLRSAIRHLCDGVRNAGLCDHPEAVVLYRFSTEQMLGEFVEAAEKRSNKFLSEATMNAGASLRECAGVTHLDACLAASEVAFGVSEALGMGWEDDARLVAGSKTGVSGENDLDSTHESKTESSFSKSVAFLMVTYIVIRFMMAPLGSLSKARVPSRIPAAAAFLFAVALTYGFERLLLAIFREQLDSLEGMPKTLISIASIAIPLAMGFFAWWCSAVSGL